MTKRLLIDASHAEETRVVMLDGNRLEDFDVETQSRRQLKGNIYLAKVVRVEPSLQAAFVEYGGNRHGFLAFGEIHPDYYQIPVADRQRLLALQEEEARAEEEAEERDTSDHGAVAPAPIEPGEEDGGAHSETQPLLIAAETVQGDAETNPPEPPSAVVQEDGLADFAMPAADDLGADSLPERPEAADESALDTPAHAGGFDAAAEAVSQAGSEPEGGATDDDEETGRGGDGIEQVSANDRPAPQTLEGETESAEDVRPARQPSRFLRSYKIQEVIRRRQILLVQVVKEERGTKGAALTTYISLAGRYCVLMPNSPRGGGISRKITSAADRRRLKEVTAELDIPRGMGLIVRTAGAARPKPEIKRDGEYLLRLWDDIRETTLRSIAPSLIYEEASLIKRAIRDVYSRDVDEVLVDGEEGWRAARDYMRMLMPAHVKKVQLWPQNAQPLFAHQQVETLLDAMLSPTVQLRSGGYLVINQTEALVAIDVNSGRSTRERGIEETALRTNLEAADEAARQLRLRDLAGLIVIDFIDMESGKHNAMVERRMAEALKNDRARIQIGRISHFGLLELSRQRLRPSLAETSLSVCVQCGGTGHVRSTESAALHVLREIEEEGGRRRAAEILVHLSSQTALYILNHKRQRLGEIEQRFGMAVAFAPDESLLPGQTRIDRVRAAVPQELPPPQAERPRMPDDDVAEPDFTEDDEDVVLQEAADSEPGADGADADAVPGETAEEGERRRRRRRRRRRGGRREDGPAAEASVPMADGTEQPDIPDLYLPEPLSGVMPVPGHDGAEEALVPAEAVEVPAVPVAEAAGGEADVTQPKRGRRGGRRRRKPEEPAEESPAIGHAAYVGPTPADPFALPELELFDALQDAEAAAAAAAAAPAEPAATEAAPESNGPAPEPAETPVVAEPEPARAPVIVPVLVGSDRTASVERKKGWWRRPA
jgi:ribonuclease E